jgi:hypothetical protein
MSGDLTPDYYFEPIEHDRFVQNPSDPAALSKRASAVNMTAQDYLADLCRRVDELIGTTQ